MTIHNVEEEFGTVKDDLAKLRGDIASLSHALKDVTSDTVHEQIAAIRNRIDNMTDDAKSQGRQRLDNLTDQIEEKPLTSVLIALGVGVLIGRLFAR